MKIPASPITALFCAAAFSFFHSAGALACASPVLADQPEVKQVSGAGFRIDWKPVAGARHYEFRYSLKIPEGRTLIQREAIVTQPLFTLSDGDLPDTELLQLMVEVAAQCDTAKSRPALAQIALKNPEPGCRFEKELPVIRDNKILVPTVSGAQSYVVCLYPQNGQAVCKETVAGQGIPAPDDSPLIGITPVCRALAGKPFFLSNLSGK